MDPAALRQVNALSAATVVHAGLALENVALTDAEIATAFSRALAAFVAGAPIR